MICQPCKTAAKNQRDHLDGKVRFHKRFRKHPKNCGCPCMHKVGAWEKLFSVKRPDAQEG